jgi:hypothetical protein
MLLLFTFLFLMQSNSTCKRIWFYHTWWIWIKKEVAICELEKEMRTWTHDYRPWLTFSNEFINLTTCVYPDPYAFHWYIVFNVFMFLSNT